MQARLAPRLQPLFRTCVWKKPKAARFTGPLTMWVDFEGRATKIIWLLLYLDYYVTGPEVLVGGTADDLNSRGLRALH